MKLSPLQTSLSTVLKHLMEVNGSKATGPVSISQDIKEIAQDLQVLFNITKKARLVETQLYRACKSVVDCT